MREKERWLKIALITVCLYAVSVVVLTVYYLIYDKANHPFHFMMLWFLATAIYALVMEKFSRVMND